MKKDEDGREYMTLAYIETEKTRQGAQSDGLDERDGRMYAQGGVDCPVLLIQKYLSELNVNCNAFFQRPNRRPKPGHWFDAVPVGKTVLARMLPDICKAVDLDKRYTNHSIRATTATALAQAGMDRSAIKRVTGHRNESSLTPYLTTQRDSERASCGNILHSYANDMVSCYSSD
jgi:hypothetical protein